MKKSLLIILILISTQVFAMESKPYAGQEKRHIKALSTSEIEGLKNGKGMGLAKAAELNHFPGPLHVIDEARKLDLSKEQLKLTRQLFNKMKQEAVMTGNKIITSEQQLDKMFASGKISEVQLQNKLKEIGKHRTQLRYIHLKTHLQQKKILSQKQIEHYDVIRGYTGSSLQQHNHQH
jgi:hypothetical protein